MQVKQPLTTFITEVVDHVLRTGFRISPEIDRLYTPMARGVQNDGFRVMSAEFSKCSTEATRYVQCLTMKAWPAVKKWCQAFYSISQVKTLVWVDTWAELDLWMRRLGFDDYVQWELPCIEYSTDQVLMVRGMTLSELVTAQKVHVPLDFAVLVIELVLFSVPLSTSTVKLLRFEKVVEPYVHARLFQGLFDLYLVKSSDVATSFISTKLQQQPPRLESLSLATSVTELENLLHNTTVVGNDSAIMFTLLRSQVHTLFGKTSTHEYLHYLRVCEQEGIVPVGFQFYQKIVHPILNSPNYEQFVEYSF